jgi:hypothetical protein
VRSYACIFSSSAGQLVSNRRQQVRGLTRGRGRRLLRPRTILDLGLNGLETGRRQAPALQCAQDSGRRVRVHHREARRVPGPRFVSARRLRTTRETAAEDSTAGRSRRLASDPIPWAEVDHVRVGDASGSAVPVRRSILVTKFATFAFALFRGSAPPALSSVPQEEHARLRRAVAQKIVNTSDRHG